MDIENCILGWSDQLNQLAVELLRYFDMIELKSQVGSTCRGSFENMCWRIYLCFLYAAEKRVVILTHILSHVQR